LQWRITDNGIEFRTERAKATAMQTKNPKPSDVVFLISWDELKMLAATDGPLAAIGK